jgi:hypothetical protein
MTSDERASLLLRQSPTAATSTSFADSEEDEQEHCWEDIPTCIQPPNKPEISRLWYWVTHTGPILFYDALRLALFVVFLAPAFARFLYYYSVTSHRQVVRYKDSSSLRHVVDLYGATTTSTSSTTTTCSDNKKPVLIFFTGGAWVIGYKMWGAFLAKVFCAMGVLVVIPDYPNYPFVTVPDMVEDAEVAIQWTLDVIGTYHILHSILYIHCRHMYCSPYPYRSTLTSTLLYRAIRRRSNARHFGGTIRGRSSCFLCIAPQSNAATTRKKTHYWILA